MDANHQLSFLQHRIEEIGSAIFYNLSESVLKLPTSIVTTLKVDEFGFVWFMIQKPKQNLSEFEKEFPVKLDYYRKGSGCFLQVTGQGFMVTDPEEMNNLFDLSEDLKQSVNDKMTLVKVKIQKADYYQTRTMENASWWQSAWHTLTAWFRHNTFRHGNTYYPAS
ncbi:pyridoxamine 5'-phosphate oxidase family protein [Flavisolibacter sp. BT320]|nr:pyridoxamine 5'-phosphate oxidase family protein [Flavisolibacter longurius]